MSDGHTESWTGVTALAVIEAEIAAECPAAVMTGRARLATRGVEMLGRVGRTDLSRLRCAGGDFVAVGAGESLTCAVVRVAESVTKSARVCGRWAIGFLIVADAAGTDLASGIGFTCWCVTGVAVVMRREIRRDR